MSKNLTLTVSMYIFEHTNCQANYKEISKETNIDYNNVKTIIRRLINNKIIIKDENDCLSINLENPDNILFKRIASNPCLDNYVHLLEQIILQSKCRYDGHIITTDDLKSFRQLLVK